MGTRRRALWGEHGAAAAASRPKWYFKVRRASARNPGTALVGAANWNGFVASRPAAAQCPYADSVRICGQTRSYTVPARGDSVPYCFISGDALAPREAAGYDIPAGLVWADGASTDLGGPEAMAQSRDQYWIVGSASAAPINGTAQLAVNG